MDQFIYLWSISGTVKMQDEHTNDGYLKACIWSPPYYNGVLFKCVKFNKHQMKQLESFCEKNYWKAVTYVKKVENEKLTVESIGYELELLDL